MYLLISTDFWKFERDPEFVVLLSKVANTKGALRASYISCNVYSDSSKNLNA